MDTQTTSQAKIAKAIELFAPHLPPNTVLTIEETDNRLCAKVIIRLTYTSTRSGRKMNMIAKGDNVPTKDDSTLRFYLMQLILTPAEIGREFSRLAWLEKRARQDAFLMGVDSGRGIRVADPLASIDTLSFEGYS